MIYAISDIHGEYDEYRRMLEKIEFSERDTLYVVGDVLDRGAQGIRILQDMMRRPNVVPLVGNHEYMALSCLRFLIQEVTEESVDKLDEDIVESLLDWQDNGGTATMEEFHRLNPAERQRVIDYLGEFELCAEVVCNGERFVLVHAGLDNFSTSRPLADYNLDEVIFHTPDYERVYFADAWLVTGHLPTRFIEGHGRPDHIFRKNRHIAIDCGCCYGGRLGAIRLDDGAEFYV